jgi:hypothetical protein
MRTAAAPQRGARGAAGAPAGDPDAFDISAIVQPLVEEVERLQVRVFRATLRQSTRAHAACGLR